MIDKTSLVQIANGFGNQDERINTFNKEQLFEYILSKDPNNLPIQLLYDEYKKHKICVKKYVSEHKQIIKNNNKQYYHNNRDEICCKNRKAYHERKLKQCISS